MNFTVGQRVKFIGNNVALNGQLGIVITMPPTFIARAKNYTHVRFDEHIIPPYYYNPNFLCQTIELQPVFTSPEEAYYQEQLRKEQEIENEKKRRLDYAMKYL